MVDEARTLLWTMVDVNMRTIGAFMKCNLENVGKPRDADPLLWSSILKRLQLSPKQHQALLATRRQLLANIGALLAEREQLGTKIRVSPCPVLRCHQQHMRHFVTWRQACTLVPVYGILLTFSSNCGLALLQIMNFFAQTIKR